MKKRDLNEDKTPQKLPIKFSTKIIKQINSIEYYNQDKSDGIFQWYEYIEGIKRHISNSSIAWDYANRYTKFPNGSVHLRELGYDVAFIVKTNSYGAYVYVFKVDLKPQEFGLKIPPTIKENKQVFNRTNIMKTNKNVVRLTESKLRKIIEESVKRVLNENRQVPTELQQALKILEGIVNSSFIPFTSPAPSSTERGIKRHIQLAIQNIDNAIDLCQQCGY